MVYICICDSHQILDHKPKWSMGTIDTLIIDGLYLNHTYIQYLGSEMLGSTIDIYIIAQYIFNNTNQCACKFSESPVLSMLRSVLVFLALAP